MPTNNDLEWQSKYSELVNIPFTWIEKAQELLFCAGIIFENGHPFNMITTHNTLPIYLMLYSFAFENLFKSLIIVKENQGKLITAIDKSLDHRLSCLIKRTGIDYTQEELEFLTHLQYFGIIEGRYRFPKNWREYKKQQGGEFSTKEIDQIASLINKIENKILELLKVKIDISDFSFSYMIDGKTYLVKRRITMPYDQQPKSQSN